MLVYVVRSGYAYPEEKMTPIGVFLNPLLAQDFAMWVLCAEKGPTELTTELRLGAILMIDEVNVTCRTPDLSSLWPQAH